MSASKAKPFIHDDFLLQSRPARELYHDYAAKMPIVDYHSHLSQRQIAEDHHWQNLAQLWLSEDHYKWRVLRANGIDERFITGDASDREKFQKFSETMPYLLRNPIYDWSHLELSRYFGITDLLTPATAESTWERVRAQLAAPGCSARGFMTRSRVSLVCTADDPADSLEYHRRLQAEGCGIRVLPTWRPEKVMAMDRPEFWNGWLDKLGGAVGSDIQSMDDLLSALQQRHDFFTAAGCRLSDYGVETVPAETYTDAGVRQVFAKVRGGGKATAAEIAQFRSALIFECGRMDAAANWTWQIHCSVTRNNNTRMFKQKGPDLGFDAISDCPVTQGMTRLFDRLDQIDALPRTIVFTLNPSNNETIVAALGNFQRGPVAGKMQFGSAWWFNDQKDGMLRQLEALSQLGLLSRFVGMLTDSRSFLSFSRHEYFRRILCNLLGNDIATGQIPNDLPWIGGIVQDICYRNAVRFFGFDLPAEG